MKAQFVASVNNRGAIMNTTFRRPTALGLLAALLLSLASPGSAAFKPTTAKVSFIKGTVAIQRTGTSTWLPAALKSRVYPGDKVSAEAGSEAEITLDDGSVVKLRDKSLLVIDRLERQRKPAASITALRAVNGSMLGCIRKLAAKESKFSITTPTAVAGVRGTVFGIFVAGDSTELDVLKGEVAIAGEKGSEVLVGEKMMTTVPKGGSARTPMAMTAAQIGMMMLWGGEAIKVGSLGAASSTAWYASAPVLVAAAATAIVAAAVTTVAIVSDKGEPPSGSGSTTIPTPPGFPGQP